MVFEGDVMYCWEITIYLAIASTKLEINWMHSQKMGNIFSSRLKVDKPNYPQLRGSLHITICIFILCFS